MYFHATNEMSHTEQSTAFILHACSKRLQDLSSWDVAALPGRVSYSTFALRSVVEDFTLSDSDLCKSISMDKVIAVKADSTTKHVSVVRCAASSVGKNVHATIR